MSSASTRPSPTPPGPARHKHSTSPLTSSSQANGSSQQQTAAMQSASKIGRGSTPTAGRSAVKAAEGEKPARPSSKDSLKQKIAKKAEDPPKPSKSDQQLKTLKSDFDSLRTLITCKICDRLLYEPYIISCGHTYCYSCLCTWFVNNKARKTCPDCRAVVTQAPAPAYVIREMTVVFINRAELLPPGETVEQHNKWQKEEADIVQDDKNNQDPRTGGLFKGCFKPIRQHIRDLRPIRDNEDGVDRCPNCSWELEEGECTHCGLFFDENGELAWGDSFGGFSDLDETSELDMSEDFDGEIDMEDADYDDYGDHPLDAFPYEPGNLPLQRFLEQVGMPPQVIAGRRRRMTHSEAGSRRSYSQSIVSDMYTDNMDTVEEEDEEDLDEDSSMNDFVDDAETPGSATSRQTSSTPEQTPQPPSQRRSRFRRVVESETSSASSNVTEEDEDEGPIRPGRRNRRAIRSRRAPSETSTEASINYLDIDDPAGREGLLRSQGWMLHEDGDEMDEDEDDDSDGGRTTVGWDATAISNDRLRMAGSLTPTADRPRPNAPIRPPSRVGAPRFLDGSRGLRRRSSVLSTANSHYEDGEADNDDSDLDQDGDIAMAMHTLRSRRSRIRMNMAAQNPNSRFANRGFSQGDAIDLDYDDASDSSQHPRNRHGNARGRSEEYNPRISWMFADHQRALQEFQRAGLVADEGRSTTPIARPRTSNRNRASPAIALSPFMPPVIPPARLRTPLNGAPNSEVSARSPTSPPSRGGVSNVTASTGIDNMRTERAMSAGSTSSTSTVLTPATSTRSSPQPSINAISQAQVADSIDLIDRPPSRVSARPPSATGRRNPAAFSPAYPGFAHPNNVGLNVAARTFQTARFNNPWGGYLQANTNVLRNRNSRPVLRDQSSTATLRPRNSRASIRDGGNPPMRTQTSRVNLNHQPSSRRLNTQSSTRTLRASEHAQPPQSPSMNNTAATSPTTRPPPRRTQDEQERLGRELINQRARELGTYQPGTQRTNPFMAGARRLSVSRDGSTLMEVPSATTATASPSNHVRNNSTESINSVNSSSSATVGNTSPNLIRRRSNRAMRGALPPGAYPTQSQFAAPPVSYNNTFLPTQRNAPPLAGAPTLIDLPLTSNTQGMSPMVAASGDRRF